jgi:ammonia channel protein AmtB
LSGTKYLAAAIATINTTLAGCSALCTGLVLERLLDGYYSFWNVLNCILAGLVGITAPCATIPPGAAIGVGILSALAYQGTARLLERLLIDDVVGAVAVHGSTLIRSRLTKFLSKRTAAAAMETNCIKLIICLFFAVFL